MSKKLLIVTAAGASVDFGFPMNDEILQMFVEKAKELFPLAKNPSQSIISWFLKRYSNANFESILYLIECMCGILQEKSQYPLQRIIKRRFMRNRMPLIIDNSNQNRKMNANDFVELYENLLDCLYEKFRRISSNLISTKSNELKDFEGLIETLKNKFEISYVTTNYDNVLTTILQDNNTGFSGDRFDRDLLLNNEKWNYGIHLHGSVFFDMQIRTNNGVPDLHKICWNDDLSRENQNSFGSSYNNTPEGLFTVSSNIIAGYDKTNQILREPFLSYYMLLDKLVYESDAILFIGYGFQDNHLNSIFPFIRENGTNIRKVVVIDKIDVERDAMKRPNDDWINGLHCAVPFTMNDKTKRRPKDLIRDKQLDDTYSDKEHPLAIWYGGLMSACDNAVTEQIINNLS
jgi:predicted house-cleaning noncanonical NTP pyrophosphatase (MazG superfamily)